MEFSTPEKPGSGLASAAKKEAMDCRGTGVKGDISGNFKLTNVAPTICEGNFLTFPLSPLGFPSGNHWGRKQPGFPESQERKSASIDIWGNAINVVHPYRRERTQRKPSPHPSC